jgi:hypothetical protein
MPERAMTVYANTTDFGDHASFNPSPLVEPLFYQTSVTITAFSGRQAAYNGLFTIYNNGSAPLRVAVDAGNVSGDMETVRMWMTLAEEAQPAMTLLTESAKAGNTTLTVGDTAGFTSGSVVLADSVVPVTTATATKLTTQSGLTKDAAAGDKVYLGPAFWNKGLKPVLARTRTLTLPPQGRGLISVVVSAGEGAEQQKVVLPLSVSAE